MPTEDRRLLAKLVPTFAVRGRHVVSVTDPYGRILCLLDRPFHINKNLSTNKVLFKFTDEIYQVLNIKSMFVEYLVIFV
jgi:hypothetical protein